jgi:hypothetical protein
VSGRPTGCLVISVNNIAVWEQQVIKPIKLGRRFDALDPLVALARSFRRLKLTKSRCTHRAADLPTITAIEHELRLRDAILFQLRDIRSRLVTQMTGKGRERRYRSDLANRQGVGADTRRQRSHRYRRYHHQ